MDRIRWSFRRPSSDDPLPNKFQTARLCLIVELTRPDEDLPSYQAAVADPVSSVYYTRGLPPPSYSEANMQELLQQNSSLSESTSSGMLENSMCTNGTYPATCSSETSLLLAVPEPAVVRHNVTRSTAGTQ